MEFIRRLKEVWDAAVTGLGLSSSAAVEDKAVPGWLTLQFSEAADINRVSAIFEPHLKDEIDPHGYVVKRAEPWFSDSITNAGAGFLADQNGDVQTLTMLYRVHEDENAPVTQPHDYTETGTTITKLTGFASAQLVIAAITLKEWWDTPPQRMMIADIKTSNIPSVKTYEANLHWEQAPDNEETRKAGKACDRTVLTSKDKATNITAAPNPQEHWYRFTDRTLKRSAEVLLEFLNKGCLTNKHTGEQIQLDLSALERIGLTPKRLEAIAAGMNNQQKIRAIDIPPAGPSP